MAKKNTPKKKAPKKTKTVVAKANMPKSKTIKG